MIRTSLLVCILTLLSSCMGGARALRTSSFPGDDPTAVVVMLPGIGATDRTFGRKGIVRAARDAGVRADIVTVNAHVGYYVGGTLVERLQTDVLRDLHARYERVDALGISLGGFGLLKTAVEDPDAFGEVVLLSPFTGRRSVRDGIRLAGGLARWQPPPDPHWDHEVWTWLKRRGGVHGLPRIWLGYGDDDPIVGRPDLLLDLLPAGQVVRVDGGHRWKVWRELVGDVVTAGALAPPVSVAHGE